MDKIRVKVRPYWHYSVQTGRIEASATCHFAEDSEEVAKKMIACFIGWAGPAQEIEADADSKPK